MSRHDDFNEEIREHIEMETRDNIGRGMSPEDARRAAMRTFGNATTVQQELREGARFAWIGTLLQDIRYALRLLKRNWILSGAIVVTLTLGIGLNTGVFTVLNGMLLRPRVEKDPDTFAHVVARYSGSDIRPVLDGGVSITDFRAYLANIHSLENVAAWGIGRSTVGQDDPTQLLILPVTCNFFSLYGLENPRLGRLFRADECEQAGSSPVAVISEELWRDQFSSDPQIVGATIRLNHQPFTIIGVTPAHFAGRLRGPGIWVPFTMQAMFFNGHDFFRDSSVPWLMMEGRLKPGQQRSTAAAELSIIAHQQDQLGKDRKTRIAVTNGSFFQEPGGNTWWLAPLVMGALMLILLLACTNVTMLLLSRAAARQQEIAVRLSLGAGRTRLLRMLLTESLILAAAAGGISAWIAAQVPVAMEKLIPGMPYYPLKPDMLVFTYLAAITLIAGMLAGIAPAAESLKVDLTSSLKGQQGFFGTNRSHTRGFLVGAQVAMSFVLLFGAGLFVRAEFTVFSANPGFETHQVLVFNLRTPQPQYTAASANALYRTLEQRLLAVPGIQSVSFTSSLPFSSDEGNGPADEIRSPGQAKGSGLTASIVTVSPAFFETFGIRIARGRAFRNGEAPAKGVATPIVVTNAMARTFWRERDPLGQIVNDSNGDPLEVVGVAPDVKSQRFGVIDGPLYYRLRDPRAYGDSFAVRFQGDPTTMQLAVRSLIHEMDREMFPRIQTMQSAMDAFAAIFWKAAEIVLILGVMALVLAIVGIYGVVSFAVSRRAREMGIRMALGATRADIVRAVLGSGARSVLIGLGIGMLIAIAGAAVLAKALQITPVGLNVTDPIAYLAAAFVLSLTAFAAMSGPAVRAAYADPAHTLRQD